MGDYGPVINCRALKDVISFCGRLVGELAGTAKKGGKENGGNRQKERQCRWRERGVNFLISHLPVRGGRRVCGDAKSLIRPS